MVSLLCFCAWGCCVSVTLCLLLLCSLLFCSRCCVSIALRGLSLLVNLFPSFWQLFCPSWCQGGHSSRGSNIWHCFQLKVGTFCFLHKHKWFLPALLESCLLLNCVLIINSYSCVRYPVTTVCSPQNSQQLYSETESVREATPPWWESTRQKLER